MNIFKIIKNIIGSIKVRFDRYLCKLEIEVEEIYKIEEEKKMSDDHDINDWRNKTVNDNICIMYRCRFCGYENIERYLVVTHIKNKHYDDLKELL